jgi:hypothetical protein
MGAVLIWGQRVGRKNENARQASWGQLCYARWLTTVTAQEPTGKSLAKELRTNRSTMDNAGFFQERGKSLEDLFFLEHDRILIEKLHQLEKMKETKAALAKVSGITDEDALQRLVELDIRPEIVASLALVPLIAVAWADGKIDKEEKAAVLEAASESFVSKDSPDSSLLQQWMEHKPGSRLLEAWRQYIKGLSAELSEHQKAALKKDFIGHARQVAEATGGFLGLGNKISKPEKEVLEKLESAFDGE